MAEYIDRDKLLWNRPEMRNPNYEGKEEYHAGWNACCGEIYYVIKNAPTEDVVPRSEVERWERKYKTDIEIEESTVHRLQNILLQFTDIVHKWGNKNGIDTTEISLVPILEQEANSIIEKAKQEVAREIFDLIKLYKQKWANGEVVPYRFIAELEKKYIGRDTNVPTKIGE